MQNAECKTQNECVARFSEGKYQNSQFSAPFRALPAKSMSPIWSIFSETAVKSWEKANFTAKTPCKCRAGVLSYNMYICPQKGSDM